MNKDTARVHNDKDNVWQIAIHGTFDVENYGDLLFPIIAEAELTRRLGAVNMHRFSYHQKPAEKWPYAVTSLTELPALAHQMDATLIGGGFIIRFDKCVADGYLPPDPSIHHPTGYWLVPALMALQNGVPLIWNAPGMHCNEIPEWGRPLLALAVEHSPHVRVRDALTQKALQTLSPHADIEVLPDTAFGLAQVLDIHTPSAELRDIFRRYDLAGPYVVVHATQGLQSFLALWRSNSDVLAGVKLLVLPIGPVLGDHPSALGAPLDRAVTLPFWPSPLLLAELIAHSAGVVGHSYHLAISAIAFGLPVFCSADLEVGKFTALPAYGRVFQLRHDQTLDPQWLVDQLGRRPLSAATCQAVEQLREHWDQVAQLIVARRAAAPEVINRIWQSLPVLLENMQGPQPAAVETRHPLAQATQPDWRSTYHRFKRLISRSTS